MKSFGANTRCLQLIRADIIVIGGGAAGMTAAGFAALSGARVLLAEPNRVLGKKLRITGKGRCNVTNNASVRDVLANVPRNPKFLYSCMNAFPPTDVMAFFESFGVFLKTERGNRVFPLSDSAHEVADKLEAWMRNAGVSLMHNRVLSVKTGVDGAVCGVVTDKGEIPCKAVIIATGGLSYPATGSTGDGYGFAGALGHTVVPPVASLVPLESPDGFCAEMTGFSPKNVTVTVYEDEKPIFKDMGEMLFAHFGVTGPLILSASAHMRHFDRCKYHLSLDLKPALDEEKLDARILRDFEKYGNRDAANGLTELVPRTMLPAVLKQAGIAPDKKLNSVTRLERRRLLETLKGFVIRIDRPRPVSDGIITSGGVEVRELDPRTMGSKLVPGLYFAGEILDVDAYTGGFNLQIAWATGRCAGLSAGKEVQNER